MTKAEVVVRFDCTMNEGETADEITDFVIDELNASGICDEDTPEIVEIKIVEVDDE